MAAPDHPKPTLEEEPEAKKPRVEEVRRGGPLAAQERRQRFARVPAFAVLLALVALQ